MNVKKEARKFINQTEIKEELDIAQRVWLEFHIIDLLEAHASSKMPSDRCNHQYVEAQSIEFKNGIKLEKAMVCVLCRTVKSLAKPTKKP